MKRSFGSYSLFFLLIVFTLVISPLLFAQTAGTGGMPDLNTIFTSVAGLGAMVLFVTAFLKKLLSSNDTWTQVISGGVALVLSIAGYLLQMGIFAGAVWYMILIYGLSAMLIANGISTWGVISAILTFFKLKVPSA